MKDVSRRVKSSRRIDNFPPTFNCRELVSSLKSYAGCVLLITWPLFTCKRQGGRCVHSQEPDIKKQLDSLAHPVQRWALLIRTIQCKYQISSWSKPNPASIPFCPISISYMSYEKLFSSNLNITDLTREAKIVWKQPEVRAIETLLRGKNSLWYLHQMFPTEDKKQASSLSQRKQLLQMTGKYGSPLFYCLGLWKATCFKADTLDSQLYSSGKILGQ